MRRYCHEPPASPAPLRHHSAGARNPGRHHVPHGGRAGTHHLFRPSSVSRIAANHGRRHRSERHRGGPAEQVADCGEFGRRRPPETKQEERRDKHRKRPRRMPRSSSDATRHAVAMPPSRPVDASSRPMPTAIASIYRTKRSISRRTRRRRQWKLPAPLSARGRYRRPFPPP